MRTQRLLETAAMMIIGDSVLCMASPRRHLSLWLNGPGWWQRLWQPFIRNAGMTRALGAAGLGFGLWLAWREEPTATQLPSNDRWTRRLVQAMQ
jgi:hypothetical protein